MPKFWEEKVILSKMELTYGTDANPLPANAILARNVTWDPNPRQAAARDLVNGRLGNVRQPQVLRHSAIQFDVELTGAGAVDTPPAYGPLLRAAGLAETINASTSVEYDPVSAGYESNSLYFYDDGILSKVLGLRGSVAVVIQPDEVPLLRFSFQGLYSTPADAAQPEGDFSAFQDPTPVSNVATPTFTLHGEASVLHALQINLNQAVTFRDKVGAKDVQITGRDPRGSVTIERPAIATKNWHQVDEDETLAALQLVHGSAAGSIVQIDAPKVQLTNPRPENVENITYLTMDMVVTEDAGDDELKITTK